LPIEHFYTVFAMTFDPHRDYPLGSQRPDLVTTPRGIRVDELSLHGDGVQASELRVTSETLRLQAEVADASRRSQLADNLRRAAELAGLPDEMILEIYTALRPRRSSASELESWAQRLESLGAPLNAAFVRDALRVYAQRGLLAA
jgi:propanediol dehydratase small subunit